MALSSEQDAFGHMMEDYLKNKEGFEIIERDDGYFDVSSGPQLYFAPYEKWWPIEQHAMRFVRGRVLDIGCGAGRHTLYLQEQGFDVTGVDNSPLAVKVSKSRGVKDVRVVPITRLSSRLGIFDTIIMMGNNFALTGTPRRARWLLRRFYHMTTPGGRILAETVDAYKTNVPEHLAYHEVNRQRGRLGGQLRFRVHYKKYVTPWIDFLIVSQPELQEIVEGTGWHISDFLESDLGIYIAVLEK
jgi:2-polyprenyl-3-methyl-5-hydroxy-6-metoxy-1,4-benzoquinol methylase